MSSVNKFAFVLVLLHLNNAFAEFNQSVFVPRIFYGKSAQLGQFPYQVSIRGGKNLEHSCGGSIVDPKHIVTAAHCVENVKPSEIEVQLGSILQNEGSKYSVEKIIVHEKFSVTIWFDNDIAVLRLKDPIPFNDYTNIIKLPSGKVSQGTSCIVSGWGISEKSLGSLSNNLIYANVLIANWFTCSTRYEETKITTNMICAGDSYGRSSCMGDSGGPLACKTYSNSEKPTLTGIVSFGPDRCGDPYLPSVYTNVYQYVNWIKRHSDAVSTSTSLCGMQPLAILISSIIYTILFH